MGLLGSVPAYLVGAEPRRPLQLGKEHWIWQPAVTRLAAPAVHFPGTEAERQWYTHTACARVPCGTFATPGAGGRIVPLLGLGLRQLANSFGYKEQKTWLPDDSQADFFSLLNTSVMSLAPWSDLIDAVLN